MKALVTTKFGTPPVMGIEMRDAPEPKPGHSIVRVHAALVNPLSNQVRSGFVPGATPPLVLGVDGSGVVEQSDVFAKGTRVAIDGGGQLGVSEDGLQQEQILVDNARLVELPDAISLDQGAALMVNYITAYQAMNRVGRVQPGQRAVISGASGGVGQALIQVARALGVVPIALVSGPAKVDQARQAGAEHVIDLSGGDAAASVLELTGGGADIAFDTVGGEVTGKLFAGLRVRGAVVSIGFVGGTEATVDLVDIVVSEKRLLGYDVFLETPEDKARVFNALAGFVENGTIRPHIDSVFPLENYEEAYARLTSRRATGPILLHLS